MKTTTVQAPAAPPAPTVDPNFATEQAQANSANISALQTEAQSDTASLMARYGTKLALAGMSSSAAVAAGSPSPASTSAPSDPYSGTIFAGQFGAVLASTVRR